MANQGELRREIEDLQLRARMTENRIVRAEIELLIEELERQLLDFADGEAIGLTPNSVWWPEPLPPSTIT